MSASLRALLLYPSFPRSYWGQEYTHPLTGKRAVVPPLGLLTVAALLPSAWDLRLVDLNVEPLDEATLAGADLVLISAIRVQHESFHELVRRAHAAGKRVVADEAAGAPPGRARRALGHRLPRRRLPGGRQLDRPPGRGAAAAGRCERLASARTSTSTCWRPWSG